MPEDFENGYGVEILTSDDESETPKETYFGQRDLTINEVLATDTTIEATRDCIIDTVRHIIRLTDFENNEFNGAGPKMLSKIIRFYAESIHRYGEPSIEGVEDWQFEDYFIRPFWIALQLERACEVGEAVAQEYVNQLLQKKQIPLEIATVEEATGYLINLMSNDDKPFFFRFAPVEQYSLEDELVEDRFDKITQEEKKYSRRKFKK